MCLEQSSVRPTRRHSHCIQNTAQECSLWRTWTPLYKFQYSFWTWTWCDDSGWFCDDDDVLLLQGDGDCVRAWLSCMMSGWTNCRDVDSSAEQAGLSDCQSSHRESVVRRRRWWRRSDGPVRSAGLRVMLQSMKPTNSLSIDYWLGPAVATNTPRP